MPKQDKRIVKYKTKKGIRYKFQAYLGLDQNGKKRNVTRQGFPNYNEAKFEMDKLLSSGADTYTKPKQMKLKDLYVLWKASYIESVKETTWRKSLPRIEKHILAHFSNAYVDSITTYSVQRWINQMYDSLIDYRKLINYFRNILKLGVAIDLIKSNPFDKAIVPKPKERKPKKNYYTRDELEQFLIAAKQLNPKAYTYFLLLSSTGLREGEALALEWSDIDLKNEVINIDKTLVFIGHELKVQSPKTHESIRKVPISDKLKKQLIEYHKINTNKLLFPSPRDGYYLNLTAPHWWISEIHKINPSLPEISNHGFRHTFATLFVEANPNLSPKILQGLLGHTNVNFSLNVYSHLNKEKLVYQSNKYLNKLF